MCGRHIERGLEALHAEEHGQVEQHAAQQQRFHGLDAVLRIAVAARRDGVGITARIDHAAAGDVVQRINVRAVVAAHREHVAGGGNIAAADPGIVVQLGQPEHERRMVGAVRYVLMEDMAEFDDLPARHDAPEIVEPGNGGLHGGKVPRGPSMTKANLVMRHRAAVIPP